MIKVNVKGQDNSFTNIIPSKHVEWLDRKLSSNKTISGYNVTNKSIPTKQKLLLLLSLPLVY